MPIALKQFLQFASRFSIASRVTLVAMFCLTILKAATLWNVFVVSGEGIMGFAHTGVSVLCYLAISLAELMNSLRGPARVLVTVLMCLLVLGVSCAEAVKAGHDPLNDGLEYQAALDRFFAAQQCAQVDADRRKREAQNKLAAIARRYRDVEGQLLTHASAVQASPRMSSLSLMGEQIHQAALTTRLQFAGMSTAEQGQILAMHAEMSLLSQDRDELKLEMEMLDEIAFVPLGTSTWTCL